MSSLVVMPLNNQSISVILDKNLFSGFSSCGSLLSNNIDLSYKENQSSNLIFNKEEYSYYLQDYQAYNYAYFSNRYLCSNQSKGVSSFIINGNTFAHFNHLKRRTTDQIQHRKEQGVARVNDQALKNMAMIIDFFGGDNMEIEITLNTFKSIVQQFGTWNGLKYDICSQILNDSSSNLSNVLSANTSTDAFYQLSHLISISAAQNSRVIIGSNNFTNISTSGPLIYLEESERSNKYIIIQNGFRLIHGYVNSNAIQIIRKTSENPDLEGGNILITGNKFSEIAGCPTVLASAISVGIVNNSQRSPQSQALGIPSELPSLDSNSDIQSGQIEQLSHQIYGSLYLNSNTLLMDNNTFINVSMGVARQIDNYQSKGGLIKIVNIPQAQIRTSTFQNIGAYTVEHSRQLQSLIFGISEDLISSNMKGELFSDANEKYWRSKQGISEMPFMQTYLSTSLICIHGMKNFMLGESNKFSNIWLVDRFKSFDRSQLQGILFYLEEFKGELVIGGNSGETFIDSITGLINPFTIERFQSWNPQYFPFLGQIDDGYPSDELIHGAGSILFNIHNSTNTFDRILLKNLSFSSIYHRVITSDESHVSSIISTFTHGSRLEQNSIHNITLQGIKIVNSSFERSRGYFQVSSQTLVIQDVYLNNLGNWNMHNDLMWRDWNIYVPQNDALNSSIFVVSLIDKHDKGMLQLQNSSFININSNTGALPILQIHARQQRNQTKLIQMTDVLIKNCISDTDQINAPSTLFKIIIQGVQTVDADIDIRRIRIEESQSKCKINQIQSLYSWHIHHRRRYSLKHFYFDFCVQKNERNLCFYSLSRRSASLFYSI
ncbi:hypothetical protein FGO68_gene7464 [Halteria grandinella]|uniref:Uncharacterized protein n=1 Tax=Halteria grandinella TaxID=5974 RepID=A0A8J8TA92_HALGN|nr:hypothetical protein FGO68_gene7464 [Halteria grandinella]